MRVINYIVVAIWLLQIGVWLIMDSEFQAETRHMLVFQGAGIIVCHLCANAAEKIEQRRKDGVL